MDIQSAKQFIEEKQIKNIKLAVTDCDGVMRGKYVQKKKFQSALENGFGFCDVIFGWDSNDVLYDKDSFTGWQSASLMHWRKSIQPAAECFQQKIISRFCFWLIFPREMPLLFALEPY